MSTTFSVTRDELIASALRLQGYIQQGDTPSATVVTNMSQALNMMLKAWSSRGLKVWCVQEVTCPITGLPRSFQIGPTATGTNAKVTDRPLRIEEAIIRYNPSATTPTDVTLQPLSREEYVALGNKFSTGTPNSYFYDPLIPNGVIYLYTKPDSGSSAMEVHLWVRKQLDDITSGSGTFNLPSEWFQALRWGLADETSLDNQIPSEVADRIAQRAQRLREEMEDWDREYTSVYFQPDLRRMSR